MYESYGIEIFEIQDLLIVLIPIIILIILFSFGIWYLCKYKLGDKGK